MLRTLRILWAALLAGPLALLLVALFFPVTSPDPSLNLPLSAAAGAMLLVEVPVLYVLRMQLYKKNWVADAVTPQGYFTGNLLLFAGCEAAALFAGVIVLITGQALPGALIALAAMGVIVVNFPTGAPMQATPNAFNAPRRDSNP